MTWSVDVIVVVDDEAINLEIVEAALNGTCQVYKFTSGEAALDYVKNNRVDLVIMDYNLNGGVNGLDIMLKIKEQNDKKALPVIFLTASTDDDKAVAVLDDGAVDYITKPVSPKLLLSKVRHHITESKYKDKLKKLIEEKTRKIKMREDLALDMLALVTDLRDHGTGGHIHRTTEVTRVLVSHLLKYPLDGYSLSQNDADDIIKSVKLHDIGKVSTPDGVLLKQGKLTESEFEIIKRHTLEGARLLQTSIEKMGEDSFLDVARIIALYHHEKWDGSGYPYGVYRYDIPLSARIAAIADVYDALTSKRPYKNPFTHIEAIEIIKEESGKHFDPYLVSVFLEHEKEIEELVKTKLK